MLVAHNGQEPCDIAAHAVRLRFQEYASGAGDASSEPKLIGKPTSRFRLSSLMMK
jgi:hypothetical protein